MCTPHAHLFYHKHTHTHNHTHTTPTLQNTHTHKRTRSQLVGPQTHGRPSKLLHMEAAIGERQTHGRLNPAWRADWPALPLLSPAVWLKRRQAARPLAASRARTGRVGCQVERHQPRPMGVGRRRGQNSISLPLAVLFLLF